jgi:hypothetical protein
VWLCYAYLMGVVLIFKECGYGYLRDVVMLWVFKWCGYVMGI